jgi:membrane peptidoglycan carboxypeptidase
MKDNLGGYQAKGIDKGREAALVTVQPGDGAIRAMYGGSTYCLHQHRDDCTDLTGVSANYTRSPGSSMKPYTLIAALKQGIGLDSTFPGPPHIDFPGTNGKGISNSQNESCGACTLTEALARSINTIFVPLAQKVGPDNVAQVAHDAGISRQHHLDPVPTITLGTSDVSPLDQAVGYATIAAQGVRAEPYLVAQVRTSTGDRVVYRAKKRLKRVFPADVMADTTYAMTQVIDNPQGTAAGHQLTGGRPAAGKTGTNGLVSGNFDAWFIGFTPQLSTAVWYGNSDKHKEVTENGAPLYGGMLPASTWQEMMNTALTGKPVESFPPPAHVGGTINSAPPTTVAPSPTSGSASASPSGSPSSTPSTTPTVTPPTSVPPTSPSPGGGGAGSKQPKPTRSSNPPG